MIKKLSPCFKNIFKYLDFDTFCKLKDDGLHDNIINYSEYFEMRNISLIENKDNKIIILIKKSKITLLHVIMAKYVTLLIYVITYFDNIFPLNILIENNWPIEKINIAFKSIKVYYLFKYKNKFIKINSIKSAINRYNYPAILELLKLGINPTAMDLKVARYVNIKQIKDALNYFY